MNVSKQALEVVDLDEDDHDASGREAVDLDDDLRFSPAKDQALQMLDSAIQVQWRTIQVEEIFLVVLRKPSS